jgi:hypothetical protein
LPLLDDVPYRLRRGALQLPHPALTPECELISARPLREQSGMDFTAFMKSALQQDPDIILVGETRGL